MLSPGTWVNILGLLLGGVGLGFNITSVCVDCIHDEGEVRQYLDMSGSGLKIECMQWVNIVGLVLSFAGVLVSVASGCSY